MAKDVISLFFTSILVTVLYLSAHKLCGTEWATHLSWCGVMLMPILVISAMAVCALGVLGIFGLCHRALAAMGWRE